MEYLPLGNLEDQDEQQPLSEKEVLLALRQGLSATDYLYQHTPPLVHRDIKPANILVSRRPPNPHQVVRLWAFEGE